VLTDGDLAEMVEILAILEKSEAEAVDWVEIQTLGDSRVTLTPTGLVLRG
jgi:hypothetical protein